jgi:hypothetical protein
MKKERSCIGISMRSQEWFIFVRFLEMTRKFSYCSFQILKNQTFLFNRTSMKRFSASFFQTMHMPTMISFKTISALSMESFLLETTILVMLKTPEARDFPQ